MSLTKEQKQAIRVLNTLIERCGEEVFSDEDYFLLLEFVLGEQKVTFPIHPQGCRGITADNLHLKERSRK